ncbi:MAG: undecaprenyl-diphosphate phosphatase [Gemmatimonadota bacterium]
MIAGDLLKAAVLGLVEGVTEFLPVSSTGHLIVASEWLGFHDARGKTFEIFIQLGAILSIVWIYRATLLRTARGLHHGQAADRGLVLNLAVAFLPAAIVGFLFHDWIKAHLFSTETVAVALVVGGVAILAIERLAPRVRFPDLEQVPPRTALGIGLAQVLSLVPGTSRSGATIMGGYALGLSRVAATEFSFFLAIPVMVAATVFDLLDSLDALSAADIPVFAVGFVTAFISAVIVVRGFLRYVSGHSFAAFAWYRIGFGLVLLWLASGG